MVKKAKYVRKQNNRCDILFIYVKLEFIITVSSAFYLHVCQSFQFKNNVVEIENEIFKVLLKRINIRVNLSHPKFGFGLICFHDTHFSLFWITSVFSMFDKHLTYNIR